MSTEVKIMTHCDMCGAPAVKAVEYRQVDVATEPTEFTKPDNRLDLCTEHHQQWLVFHQHALPYLPPIDRPPLSGRGREPAICPECGETFTRGSGLALHRKKHGVPTSNGSKAKT